ncbi:glycosyltransferase family 4 protein [Lucifera butyrica]|uniref:glycosyltransferase family 4 protein n=1 Tax=Lucifera butyrica TaxID=1351585 RepID=UPI00140286A1|nr:glycosyltransferase family 4 protein [Lucifera butyrica]
MFELFKNLALWFDIDLVTLAHAGQKECVLEIVPGLREIRIPKSTEHQEAEDALTREIGVSTADVGLPQFYKLSPAYIEALGKSAGSADAVVTSHPYLYSAIREVSNKMLWYEAQDVEGSLKPKMLPDTDGGRKLALETVKIEQLCCMDSSLIMACSHDDGKLMENLYGTESSKITIVPNGVDTHKVKFISWKERVQKKSNKEEFNCLFLGSQHGPNTDAVNLIIEHAHHLSEVNFLIVGSVCRDFKPDCVPANVKLIGTVDDEMKSALLEKADLAINPMTYGSGTNLKMLEYFAAGLPVVSTPVGARGLDLEDGKSAIITDINQFDNAIRLVRNSRTDEIDSLVNTARRLVEKNFDWQVIAENLADTVQKRGLLKSEKQKRPNKKAIALVSPNIKEIVGTRSIFIWGAGSGGRETLELLRKKDTQVEGFIDNDPGKWQTDIMGLRVYSPTALAGFKEKPFIIIASLYATEIKQQLNSYGYIDQSDYKQRDLWMPYIFLW